MRSTTELGQRPKPQDRFFPAHQSPLAFSLLKIHDARPKSLQTHQRESRHVKGSNLDNRNILELARVEVELDGTDGARLTLQSLQIQFGDDGWLGIGNLSRVDVLE